MAAAIRRRGAGPTFGRQLTADAGPAAGMSLRSPFDDRLGVIINSATPDEVTGSLEIDAEQHTQPLGMVHGGVYCTIVETLASIGASMSALADGLFAVGMENHTSFIRPVRGGTLHAVARAAHRGRQTHLWEVHITDDLERAVARGSVRLALVDPHRDATEARDAGSL